MKRKKLSYRSPLVLALPLLFGLQTGCGPDKDDSNDAEEAAEEVGEQVDEAADDAADAVEDAADDAEDAVQ